MAAPDRKRALAASKGASAAVRPHALRTGLLLSLFRIGVFSVFRCCPGIWLVFMSPFVIPSALTCCAAFSGGLSVSILQ